MTEVYGITPRLDAVLPFLFYISSALIQPKAYGCDLNSEYKMLICRDVSQISDDHYKLMEIYNLNSTTGIDGMYFEYCSREVTVEFMKYMKYIKRLEIRMVPTEIDFVKDILHRQRITEDIIIQDGMIQSLSNLEHNDILAILRSLTLHNVRLVNIAPYAFLRLINLQTLILSNNQLKEFNTHLPVFLKHLSLRGNGLIVFMNPKIPQSLEYLDLSANPLLKIAFKGNENIPRSLLLDNVPCKALQQLKIEKYSPVSETHCNTKHWSHVKCTQVKATISQNTPVEVIISERPKLTHDTIQTTQWWMKRENGMYCYDSEDMLNDAKIDRQGSQSRNAMERLVGPKIVWHLQYLKKYYKNVPRKLQEFKFEIREFRHLIKDQIIMA